jgi:hypothetical protein
MIDFEKIDKLLNKEKTTVGSDFEPNFYLRFLSFSDERNLIILNETFNKYCNVFDSKQDKYNFLFEMIVKPDNGYVKYVKRFRKEIDKKDIVLAEDMEISRREIEMMKTELAFLKK